MILSAIIARVSSLVPIPIHDALAELSVQEYLAVLWPDRSRRTLDGLFTAGRIRSAGQPVAKNRPVNELRELGLVGPLENVLTIPIPESEHVGGMEILHEDARFVVVNKQSGLPVVPTRDGGPASCLSILVRRELSAREGKSAEQFRRYRIVHRLDRLTSGLVFIAKTAEVERRLAADFEHRRIKKEYLALLAGDLGAAQVTVDCPIGPGRKGKMRAQAGEGSQFRKAITRFETLEQFRLSGQTAVTFVRAKPETGRTHQIRVHAWATSHPLAIDPLYGRHPNVETPVLEGMDRLTLHAHRYTLSADWDEPRVFECPLPEDFRAALTWLRSHGPI